MARRGRPRGSGKKQESVKPSEVLRIPSENKLKQLMKNVKNAEADKNESVGRIGSLISQAVEKENLDKVAFGLTRRFERMSANKGSTSYSHFLHYVRVFGLEDKWAEQMQMFERPETDPGMADVTVPEEAPASEAKQPRGGSFAEKMAKASAIPVTPTEH